MDTHSDDLKDVERRFAACEPATDNLNADAMLFAAGRASVRPSPARFVWPALTLCLAVVTTGLGVWLAQERTERLRLTLELNERPTQIAPPSPALVPPAPPTANEPPSSSPLAVHRMLEQGLDPWPPADSNDEPPGPAVPDPPVLTVGLPNKLIVP